MVDDSHPKLLLVEGVDDKAVVKHFHDQHQHLPEFAISNKRGLPGLLDSISPEIKVSGRTALGIMADSNEDLHARWQAISNRLKAVNVPLPSQLTLTGTIINHNPRVGIWLMPDNNSSGELEDFVRRLIPSSDPVWPRAQEYINNIPQDDRKFKTKKIVRAQVHAWLAARSSPRKMGTAIRARDLDATVPLATDFADWLFKLFG